MSRGDDEVNEVQPKKPGAFMGALAMFVGFAWIIASALVAYTLIGTDGFAALNIAQIAAIVAGILLPALMAFFAGSAAREGARARLEAQRLADAADRLLRPDQAADEAARKLAMSVRSEISTLDHALEQTLSRLREVEGVIARQAQAVDEMSGVAREGAGAMISGMEREREELMKISRELNSQAQNIGGSISRHTQAISDAARMAEAEVRAADQALDHRLTSFGAAAALITDRTQALSGAAQTSADSALRLESALSNALDVLAKATSLTDAARQSAEAASIAASSTSSALRDGTSRAIEDAKRAADVIRGEAAGVEREAAIALERLRDAAEAARAAAIGARHAVEDEYSEPAPQPARQRRAPPQRAPEAPPRQEWRREEEPDPLEAAPPPRYRAEPQPQPEALFGEAAPVHNERTPPGENWTWRDLLSSIDEDAAPSRSPNNGGGNSGRGAPREDAVTRLTHQLSEPRTLSPNLPATELIERSGIHIDEVFSASGLERVAQRARSGTQARRRSVKDAAPDAVRHLANFLARDPQANQEAMQFLRNDGARIAELLARGRAAMGAEATRAFLLIDSAAG